MAYFLLSIVDQGCYEAKKVEKHSCNFSQNVHACYYNSVLQNCSLFLLIIITFKTFFRLFLEDFRSDGWRGYRDVRQGSFSRVDSRFLRSVVVVDAVAAAVVVVVVIVNRFRSVQIF